MAVASSASVSQITAVSSPSAFVNSSWQLKATAVVSFGMKKLSHGCGCGWSSSRFFGAETPFSLVAAGVEDKPGRKSGCVQTQSYKQNEDLPPSSVSPRVKKPYVKPVRHGSHQKRMRRRELRQLPPKPLKAPANGMVVERLVPVAHSVYEAYSVVLDGVSRLMKHLPVKACRWCSEIHVARAGHQIKTCVGKNNSGRFGEHLWVPGYPDDVVVPLEAFHLVDRLQKPIRHEERFKHERIPAIVELCIQAGLDVPEFPTVRRTTPIDSAVSRQRVDGGEEHANDDREKAGGNDIGGDESKALACSGDGEEQCVGRDERKRPTEGAGESGTDGSDDAEGWSEVEVLRISDDDDPKAVAEKTLRAWDKMRAGAASLMNAYPVRACGYCPEVHIGRRGHKLQLCGAFKHQWRNGQHGWQDAALDDLIPPRYVWHVRDKDGAPLTSKLAKYYGKAPAVVELCVQAGADIPGKYKARMRLDVIIPDEDELEMVA